MYKAALVSLALLAISGAQRSDAADAPALNSSSCQLKRFASIDVDISPEGMVLIPASINGTEVWMTFVTDSPTTVVSDSIATELKLPRRNNAELNPTRVEGKDIIQLAFIRSFRISSLEFRESLLAVNPAKGVKGATIEKGRPIAGFLGLNAFGKMDFELNFAAKKINVFSPDHCPGKVVYWTSNYSEMPYTKHYDGSISFPLELDGTNIESTFATGHEFSNLDSNLTRKVYGFDENSPDVTRSTTGEGHEESSFKAMALTATGLNIINTPVKLFKGDNSCGYSSQMLNKIQVIGYSYCSNVPMRLGMNVLTKLRIYVSTKEKIIYVSRSDAT